MSDYEYYMQQMNELYHKAEKEHNFIPDNYEWELGASIVKSLIQNNAEYYKHFYPDCCHTAFGIAVRIDIENNETIKLWREIK